VFGGTKILRIAISLLTLAAACFGGSINLVTNGDFETGDFTGWNVNEWDTDGFPHGGNFAAETGCVGDPCINGTSLQQAFLNQTLTTIVGHTYTLSFWYDPGTVQSDTDTSELLVQWDGGGVVDLVLVGTGGLGSLGTPSFPSQTPGAGYNQYAFSGLTVSSTGTLLTFLGRQDPAFSNLDDIIVTDDSAVPEPSTYLLAAGGLLALGLRKKRRA
jgi:hypothetical protein